jgi:hypothetical protein
VLAQALTVSTSSASSAMLQDLPVEIIEVWHDGVMFVPEIIKLKQWKNYKLVVTPSSNGRWCNAQVVIPWKWPHTIIKWQPFEIMVDGSRSGVTKLVCASMWMEQWQIVVQ